MGLDSIWTQEGEYLTKANKKKGKFSARSTGCSCCSSSLDSEEDVLEEAVNSLGWILVAANHFGWNMTYLLSKAKDTKQMIAFAEKKSEV